MPNYGDYSSRHYYPPEPARDEPAPSRPPRFRDTVAEVAIETGVDYLFRQPSVRRGVTQLQSAYRDGQSAAREGQAAMDRARREGVSFPMGGGRMRVAVDERRPALNATYSIGRDRARASLREDGASLETSTRSPHHRDRARVEYASTRGEDSLRYTNERNYRSPNDGYSNLAFEATARDNGGSFRTTTDERQGSHRLRRDVAYGQRDDRESLRASQNDGQVEYVYATERGRYRR